MSQRKPNRTTWYSLGLTVLLCVALLVVATGTALARYRAEREEKISFCVRVPDQICLGTVSMPEEEGGTEVFIPSDSLTWDKNAAGTTQLEFAVANGTEASDYSARDQRFRLRMIGTLGLGEQMPTLKLILPPEEGGQKEREITATVSPFAEGTALQIKYGDGWLYTFLDEEGEELYWELPGGELSFVTMTVTIEGTVPDDVHLLQPQVTAEVVRD